MSRIRSGGFVFVRPGRKANNLIIKNKNTMKKATALILIITFSLFLGGCFKKKAPEAQNSASPEDGLTVKENNTLMGWLKKGKGVECTVSSPEGNITVKTKDNKVRIDGIPYAFGAAAGAEAINNGVSLTDGDWTYFWSGKEGMKMNNKKMEELSADLEQKKNAEDNQWENMVGNWEEDGFNYDCSNKTLLDNIFTPPSDVVFTDLTEMMSGLSEISKDLEKQLEAGEPVDAEALEEAMKALQLE